MNITVFTWFELPPACRPGHPQRRRPTLDEVKAPSRSNSSNGLGREPTGCGGM